MSNLILSEGEVAQMRQMLLTQLAEAEMKVQSCKDLLAKLGGIGTQNVAAAPAAPVVAAPAAVETPKAAKSEKVMNAVVSYMPEELQPRPGRSKVERPKERKSEWGSYVLNTLRQQGKLMTATEIMEHAMKRAKNQERGEVKVRLSITGPINRMVHHTYRLRALKIKGVRGTFFGPAGWFNVDGSLKAPYNEQFGPLNIIMGAKGDSTED